MEYGENTKEDDFPTRQIFAFTTADQDFNADFYWEPLQEDVPEDEQSDPFDLPYDWVARLHRSPVHDAVRRRLRSRRDDRASHHGSLPVPSPSRYDR